MLEPFTFGSLFAGIGGIDLGLERAGMTCLWQVEINEYATKVLFKHWPHITRFRDIRDCGAHNLRRVDLIAGGFPCQDISDAGKRLGLDGKRSSLWSEMYRIVCELRPRYVLVENVAALTYRGLDRVLGALAQAGYDAEWTVLRASDFGLFHERKRLFLVAYPYSNRQVCVFAHYPQRSIGLYSGEQTPDKMVLLRDMVAQLEQRWGTSSVCRIDDGLPCWLDRLEAVGNAVVPHIAEYIGRSILMHAQEREVSV